MQQPLSILAVLLVLGTVGVFFYDLRTRKYEFFSFRNIFLLGFAHFFGVGTYFTAMSGFGTDMYTASEHGYTLLFLCTIVFVVAFAIAQWVGQRWQGMRRLIPAVELPLTQRSVNISVLALMFAAFAAAVLPNSGYWAATYSQFRGGMATAAVGLAFYALLCRGRNPMAWLFFVGTLGAAALLCMVGDIGRRNLFGVALVIVWMWYFMSLRNKPVGSTIVKVGAIMAVGFMALVIYAGFRGEGAGAGIGKGGWSIQTRIQQIGDVIANPTIESSAVESSIKSDAPVNTMFIMENYPSVYNYEYLHGARFLLSNPIPRSWWPNKPRGMGVILQEQMRLPANLGVGILGHGWAEGGVVGVISYALFFGVLTAGMDQLVRRRMWNPFFLAAIGSSLGNVYALSRGETSLFLLQVMLSFFGVIIILYPLKLFLGPILTASSPLLCDANRACFEPEPLAPEEEFEEYVEAA